MSRCYVQGDCTFVITGDGDIYCAGGGNGSTAFGGIIPRKLTMPLPAVNLVSDGTYVLVKLQDGQIIGTGSNQFGQLGFHDQQWGTKTAERHVLPVPAIVEVRDMFSFSGCSIIIAADDTMYVWGQYGVLGLGRGNADINPVTKSIVNEEKVAQLSGGLAAVAVSTNGNVYTCGRDAYDGVKGMLGRGKDIPEVAWGTGSFEIIPYFVREHIQIHKVSCGRYHTLALCVDKRRVYGWGSSSWGQLGLGDGVKDVSTPQQIPVLGDQFTVSMTIEDICCGDTSSLVLCKDSSLPEDSVHTFVYSTGDNYFGSLGRNPFKTKPSTWAKYLSKKERYCAALESSNFKYDYAFYESWSKDWDKVEFVCKEFQPIDPIEIDPAVKAQFVQAYGPSVLDRLVVNVTSLHAGNYYFILKVSTSVADPVSGRVLLAGFGHNPYGQLGVLVDSEGDLAIEALLAKVNSDDGRSSKKKKGNNAKECKEPEIVIDPELMLERSIHHRFSNTQYKYTPTVVSFGPDRNLEVLVQSRKEAIVAEEQRKQEIKKLEGWNMSIPDRLKTPIVIPDDPLAAAVPGKAAVVEEEEESDDEYEFDEVCYIAFSVTITQQTKDSAVFDANYILQYLQQEYKLLDAKWQSIVKEVEAEMPSKSSRKKHLRSLFWMRKRCAHTVALNEAAFAAGAENVLLAARHNIHLSIRSYFWGFHLKELASVLGSASPLLLPGEETYSVGSSVSGLGFWEICISDSLSELDTFGETVRAHCKQLKSFTFSSASFYRGEGSTEPVGAEKARLYRLIDHLSGVKSLTSLHLSGVDALALRSLSNILVSTSSDICQLSYLCFRDAWFGEETAPRVGNKSGLDDDDEEESVRKPAEKVGQAFKEFASALGFNSTVRSFMLPRADMSDAVVQVLCENTLMHNKTLTALDLHVNELGQVNMTNVGVAAIIKALTTNKECRLGDLDISGDDGIPDISAANRKKLKAQLQLRRQYLDEDNQHVCDMDVWECHSDDPDW